MPVSIHTRIGPKRSSVVAVLLATGACLLSTSRAQASSPPPSTSVVGPGATEGTTPTLEFGDLDVGFSPDQAAVVISDAEGKSTKLGLPSKGTALIEHGGYVYVGCSGGDLVAFAVPTQAQTPPAVSLTHRYPNPVKGFRIVDEQLVVDAPPPGEASPTPTSLPAEGEGEGAPQLPDRPPSTEAPDPDAATTNPAASANEAKARAEEEKAAAMQALQQKRERARKALARKRAYAQGEVVEVEPSHVVIDLGRAQGVRKGDRVELYVDEVVDLGLEEETTRKVVQAVGLVVDVADQRSRVELGVREEVTLGAQAILTGEDRTRTPVAPPRIGNIWSLSMNVRPFLAWKARGGGSLTDAQISYRFKQRAAIHLVAEPVGFGVARDSTLAAVTAHAMASWDTRYFEAGAGVGWSIVEGNFTNNAFAIPQILRGGAIDGLNVRLFNQFVLLQDQWAWGGTNVHAQVPISRTADRWWIEMGGGAGIAGYGFFEAGVRFLLWGNGAHNSFYLRGAAGYAELKGKDGQNQVMLEDAPQFNHRGPMMTLGFEWRPGKRPGIGRQGAPTFAEAHRYGKDD